MTTLIAALLLGAPPAVEMPYEDAVRSAAPVAVNIVGRTNLPAFCVWLEEHPSVRWVNVESRDVPAYVDLKRNWTLVRGRWVVRGK